MSKAKLMQIKLISNIEICRIRTFIKFDFLGLNNNLNSKLERRRKIRKNHSVLKIEQIGRWKHHIIEIDEGIPKYLDDINI